MPKSIERSEIEARIERGEPLTLVEALPEELFHQAHLPGALRIDHTRVREQAGLLLPDRDAFIVVYCASQTCQNSSAAASALESMGYRRVHEYGGGKADWIDAGLPIEKGLPARAA